MIEFISGDILQTTDEYLVHGVAEGSQEGLGTGLALKISRKWPDVQRRFKKFTFVHKFKGGDIFVVRPEADQPGVIYIATQPDMYSARLAYLNRGLKQLFDFCCKEEVSSVSLPKIGAGRGKLDWESEVKPLLLEHLTASETQFRIFEGFKLEYEI